MHWNNGKIHESITVSERVYITDHKHSAICGGKDFIEYGQLDINTVIFGNNMDIISNDKMHLYSDGGIDALTSKYVKIISGTDNIDITNDIGIDIVSKNGTLDIVGDGYEVTIQSNNNNINVLSSDNIFISSDSNTNITTGEYINLNAGKGITISNVNYGTSLPLTGVEGRVFFKLIS